MGRPKMQKVPVTFVTGIHPEEISYMILATGYRLYRRSYRIDHHEESTSGLIATPKDEDRVLPRPFRATPRSVRESSRRFPESFGRSFRRALALRFHRAGTISHLAGSTFRMSCGSCVSPYSVPFRLSRHFRGNLSIPPESVNYRRALALARISAGVGGALTSAASSLRSFRKD